MKTTKVKKKKKDILADPILSKGHPHAEKEILIQVCPTCRGFGYVDMNDCPECGGAGII